MSTSKTTTNKKTKSTKDVASKPATIAKPNGGLGMRVMAAKGNTPPENP
jgi:hypothetical protein